MRLALVVLLAEGHLLIEDVPGVGKTTLAKALAASIDATVRRIQFTPDLLPSDVTGVAIYDQETRAFEFKPGAIFANIVVADEINRASPKTQSALLECMEERQVTVDGVSYELARPFMVMATQNPLEMEGTYPLPEAQRDRFTARVSMGYPGREAELAMLDERHDDRSARDADAGGRRRVRARPRGRRRHAARRRGGPALRGRHRRGVPALAAPPPRRLPPGRPAAPARRPRLGGPARPRPRAARRRPGAGRPRCWPTACCSPRTRRWAGAAPSRSSPNCCPPFRFPAGAESDGHAGRPGTVVADPARALPGRRRRRPAAGRRAARRAGPRPAGDLRARAAGALGGHGGPRALPARRAAHGHAGPGAPGRERRRRSWTSPTPTPVRAGCGC